MGHAQHPRLPRRTLAGHERVDKAVRAAAVPGHVHVAAGITAGLAHVIVLRLFRDGRRRAGHGGERAAGRQRVGVAHGPSGARTERGGPRGRARVAARRLCARRRRLAGRQVRGRAVGGHGPLQRGRVGRRRWRRWPRRGAPCCSAVVAAEAAGRGGARDAQPRVGAVAAQHTLRQVEHGSRLFAD